MMDRIAAVIARIDEANERDPNLETTTDGPVPAALLYGRRMTQVLQDFEPSASDELKIAARGQHIERWKRPRADYPEGRTGYLDWRRDAAQYHAARVSAFMREAGHDGPACDRVSQLMLKKNLKTDHDSQTLEDVACLVFFRWHADAFSDKYAERVLPVVMKTARKMSAKGRAAALALGLPPHVAEAIAGAG